jgi:hypothetical protein
MREAVRANWRSLARSTRGAEIAETAAILPLLFMVLIAVFWFGMAFRIYGAITHAAREGARAAVAPACATCTANDPSQNAWTAVQNAMNAAKLNPTQLQPPTTPPALCACGSSTTSCGSAVSCDSGGGGASYICVQGVSHSKKGVLDVDNVQLSSTAGANGGAGECGVSVSFQYPYKFWLPFSSLNNQTVNLRAQAQMRVETQ